MVVQYAKLDLSIDAVFADKLLPTVLPGAADGVDGCAGLCCTVSDDEVLLSGRYTRN